MHSIAIKFYSLLLISLNLTVAHGQETFSASGGDAKDNGGSVSYTLGQIVYTTNSGAGGSVAQGVQQPFEISDMTAIKESEGLSFKINVFPNPVNEFLIIEIEDKIRLNCIAYLFDVYGNILESKEIKDAETCINLQNRISATYLLKIIWNKQEVKVFKIIKN